jgi:altronate dehydratase
MANREKRGSSIDTAAEAVGRAAGQAAGVVDALRTRHPHPMAELHEALAAGREALTDLASRARASSAAVVGKTQDGATRARKAARRARRRVVKMVVQAKRTTKKAVTRAKQVRRETSKRRASRKQTPQRSTAAVALSTGKRPATRSNATKPGSSDSAANTRRLQTAHVKRRQAHASSRARRQQARRDKGR